MALSLLTFFSGGISTNLHHIWDTNMPEKLIGGYSISDAQTWAANLASNINNGAYTALASGWLDNIDYSNPVSTTMAWATDSNAFVCSIVMPSGVSSVRNKELGSSYYDSAVGTIELQIAKGEYFYDMQICNWKPFLTGFGSWVSSCGLAKPNCHWRDWSLLFQLSQAIDSTCSFCATCFDRRVQPREIGP
jgi:hypothetical protein